jgi:succinate dehydrogenase / fumarate reductase flavoprotein subunit
MNPRRAFEKLNGRGHFMDKEMPGWRFQATRDKLSLAIYREIVEGRGTPNGGVFLDITHLPLETIKKEYEIGHYYQLLQYPVEKVRGIYKLATKYHFLSSFAKLGHFWL